MESGENAIGEKRIALLIDAENAPASKIDVILAELARHGSTNVRRAYGDWTNPSLKHWEETLHPNAIRPFQQFPYSRGKNASDMALVIEAMDLLHGHSVDAFAIVSSDADFTPLVMRLLSDGATVFGFGESKTPKPFVDACSRFTYLERLGLPSSTSDQPVSERTDVKALRADTRLVLLLRTAVEASTGDDGWANLSLVGIQIANRASFDSRNYGYPKLSDLIVATNLFEVTREDKVVLVRDKRKRRAPA